MQCPRCQSVSASGPFCQDCGEPLAAEAAPVAPLKGKTVFVPSPGGPRPPDPWGGLGQPRPVFNPDDPFGVATSAASAPPPPLPQAQDARAGSTKTVFHPSGAAAAVGPGQRVRGALVEIRGKGDLGRLHAVREGRNAIGRAPGSAVRLEDGHCSNQHALLFVRETDAVYSDISTNGTLVDGRKLRGGDQSPLQSGATLTIGGTTLVFLFFPESALPR